jgi:hypothetical protein
MKFDSYMKCLLDTYKRLHESGRVAAVLDDDFKHAGQQQHLIEDLSSKNKDFFAQSAG